MTPASGVAVAASAASAASIPIWVTAPAVASVPVVASVGTPQPFVIAVDSMPPGGALQYAQIYGTLAIAAIAAVITLVMQRRQVEIAHRASKTAQHKLNLDLFEKRWKVYDTARRLIGTVVMQGNVTDEQLGVFMTGTQGAKWLFDDGVDEYLMEFLRKHAIDLQTDVAEVPGLQGEELAETRQRIRRLQELFQEELRLVDQRMGKFMRVVSEG